MADEKEKKDGRISVTIKLDPEIHAAIKKLADEDERAVSQYLERHIRKGFAPKPAVTERV